MGLLDKIEQKMNECDNHMYSMCKDRSQNHRNCFSSKCCAICYTVLHCEGVCSYLKENFEELRTYSSEDSE